MRRLHAASISLSLSLRSKLLALQTALSSHPGKQSQGGCWRLRPSELNGDGRGAERETSPFHEPRLYKKAEHTLIARRR
jgi:hypothetical protein